MNNNVEINSIKSKTAKKYINGKWKYVKKDDMLKDVHNKIVELLQKWVNTHRPTEGYNYKSNDGWIKRL